MRISDWSADVCSAGLSGDLGTSYTYGVPGWELVRERIGLSLPLALIAICLSTLIAIPLGVLAAARRSKAADLGVMTFTQLGIAVPNFWFAILLILLFAVQWQVLPAGGFAGWEDRKSTRLNSVTNAHL